MQRHHTVDRPAATARHARPPVSGPRVLLAGGLTAMDCPGGGEIQMLSLARALSAAGTDARLWRPWEDELAEADLLHLFGSLPAHEAVIRAARRRGLPVVISTIAWFDLAACWREARSLVRRAMGCARHLVRIACPQVPSWRSRLYQAADLLMPNSQAEAEQLTHLFRVPQRRIHVVPNGADPRLATADPELFAPRVGGRGFVLCAGRVEPRKNQLGLLRALSGTGTRVVILGNPVPGHEAYLAACRRAADAQVRFLGRLDHDDPLLASAYAAAGCLVLPGWFETPGLAALEAAMSGTPLVLPRQGCAREYFGPHARYVDGADRAGIRRCVLAALEQGRRLELAAHVRRYYCWETAARITREGYDRVL